jgi:hypothetical protein
MLKYLTEMSHIHLNVLCARKVVSQKIDNFCVMCKMTNFGAKKSSSQGYFLIFFTQQIKNVDVPRNFAAYRMSA